MMMNLQDANSPIMEQLIYFHDSSMIILTMIILTVLYMFMFMMNNQLNNRLLLNGQSLEIIWTLTPALFLIIIALPSLKILYLMDELNTPSLTLKIIGRQWYWSYEYSDFKKIEYDSFMSSNIPRLLNVDSHVILPTKSTIRFIVTSSDVIHSWTIPSSAMKIDAVPGRLNQLQNWFNRPSIQYGQCSEICGTNHSFMPIVLESIPLPNFMKWLSNSSLGVR
nr:cytochrome c oxidase subunit II [Zorotypus medoensis]